MESIGKFLAAFGLCVFLVIGLHLYGFDQFMLDVSTFSQPEYERDPERSTSPIQGPMQPPDVVNIDRRADIRSHATNAPTVPAAKPESQSTCKTMRNPAMGNRKMMMCTDDGGMRWSIAG